MARPKEFDRDEALESALACFWSRGYSAASLGELLDGMGIARQSLYDTYGDKHELFLEALRRYQERGLTELAQKLATAPSLRAALREILLGIAGEPASSKRRGCMMVNAIVEMSPRDEATARLVRSHQRQLTRVFEDTLERARSRGELAPGKQPRPLARYLVGVFLGLRVAAKADPDPEALADMAKTALSILD